MVSLVMATRSSGMVPASGARGRGPNPRSSPVVLPHVLLLVGREGWTAHARQPGAKFDPGRTRACNLWFRRPTPYPLGHRAARTLISRINSSRRGRQTGECTGAHPGVHPGPTQQLTLRNIFRCISYEPIEELTRQPTQESTKGAHTGTHTEPYSRSVLRSFRQELT